MQETSLLKAIIEKANNVKSEFNCEHLWASHIAVAVADFCRTKYTGLALVDDTYFPCRFEEERLRYVLSREVRLASFFRTVLSRNIRNGIAEKPFTLSLCENIANMRGYDMLSADIVFLCALKELSEPYKKAVCTATTDNAIIEILQDADKNIYDYVIEKIEAVKAVLNEKSREAASIRDWKPAAKFAEPNELADMFFGKIQKRVTENVITLKFPKFFGTADLKVSIHKAGNLYYIQDNGCAIKHLLKQTKDNAKCERALKKVCHNCWINKGRVTGSFVSVSSFFYYLQRLIFIAHADLFYTKVEKPLYYKEKDYLYLDTEKAEPINESELLEVLKSGIGFNYDENEGLYYWLDTRYSLFSGRASYLMETLENGIIRISDIKKGKIEGEIFEAFYWNNDDISPYTKFVSKIADRFGGEFDGKNIYLTDKNENFCKAIFRFFNMAVLLSEFGHDIKLPKI